MAAPVRGAEAHLANLIRSDLLEIAREQSSDRTPPTSPSTVQKKNAESSVGDLPVECEIESRGGDNHLENNYDLSVHA